MGKRSAKCKKPSLERNTPAIFKTCVKKGLVLLGKEERSKMRQKCAEHLWGRTPFGRCRNFRTNECKIPKIAILLGVVQSPKPLSPGNTKKLRKKIPNPPPGVGPHKYKKNTENIHKWYFFGHFRFFSVFCFCIFGGQPWEKKAYTAQLQ